MSKDIESGVKEVVPIQKSEEGPEKFTIDELAKRYLSEEPKFEHMYDLWPGWQDKVFHKSIEEAWPGIGIANIRETVFSQEGKAMLVEIGMINMLFERQNSDWRAFLGKDKEGLFVFLHSPIGNTGEYIFQKAKNLRPETDKKYGPYYCWEVSSLIIGSEKSKEVIRLDEIVTSGSPDMKVEMGIQFTLEGEEPTELPSYYSPSKDKIFMQNPDLRKDDFLVFLHELSHAKETHYYGLEYSEMTSTCRKLFKTTDVLEKDRWDLFQKDLNQEVAHKVVIREERRAWVSTAKLLKILQEEIQKRGLPIKFGGFEDRRKALDYAEKCLVTYDSIPLTLRKLSSNFIPTFSQGSRARARELERDINMGRISREKAFDGNFDGMTGEYVGSDIGKLRSELLAKEE